MPLTEFDLQFARTMSVVRQLAKGKHLRLGDIKIGMGEDMTIGFVTEWLDGVRITDDLSIKHLNDLCEMYEIAMVIPEL